MKLKRLAEEFDMKFDHKIFKKNIVNRQDCTLLQFITGAPIPPEFNKFGMTLTQRAKNIEAFLSFDMSAYRNLGEGLVVDIQETLDIVKSIKNQKIKKRLLALLNNLKSYAGEAVVIVEPTEQYQNRNVNRVLYHEWIHVLVDYNGLTFKDWRYNEAFTVYLEHYLKTMDNKDMKDLRLMVKKASHKKGYGQVTRRMGRFIKLFSDKRTPEKRMAALREFKQKKEQAK